MARKKVIEQDSNPKKVCSECKKEKRLKEFYKTNSIHSTDGRLNMCNACTNEQVDINDVNSVIAFLRQIDKPFFETEWNNALNSGKPPLGEYIRKANSLPMFRNKTFDNSDGMSSVGSVDVSKLVVDSDFIETEDGEVIKFSESLASKWGSYKKHEILQMEKFYQDMMLSYDVSEANHKNMLIRLAKLSVEMDNLLVSKEYSDYEKVSKVYSKTLQDAGFRPIDRKSGDEQRGLRSFSQIFEEVEKRSFVKPPPPVFKEDVVDAMIISLSNYYHRLIGKQILSEVPQEMKQDYAEYLDDDKYE